MKKVVPLMKNCLLAVLTILTLISIPRAPALAEDDLMNLMGKDGEADEVEVAPKKAEVKKVIPESPLKKMLGKTTAEQNIFVQFFDAGDLSRALFQWPSAFDQTEFAKTPSGRALSAYLLFKNGTQVYGLENLLAIDQPQKIAPYVQTLWKEAAPDTLAAWSFVAPKLWKAAWSPIFGNEIEIRVRGHQTFQASQLKEIKELIKKSPKESSERSWLEWQSVLAQATGGDSATAAKALSKLMSTKQNPVSQDLMTLTAARLLYQNGFLDAAIKYYDQVGKASDDWFDAQEEMAWAQVRKGEPQNAIAITQTLVNPAFTNLIGPEAVFVRALSLLKVCDYPEVAKTLDLYRERFRDRAKTMIQLTETGNTPAVQAFIKRSKASRPRSMELGAEGAKLPRFATRDEVLSHLIAVEKALEQEAATFAELYARSLSQGTGKVGFQGRLEELRFDLENRVKTARAEEYVRVKNLAEDELNEITQILSKMQIVEAEVIQQVSMSGRVADATSKGKAEVKKGTTGAKGLDLLKWPVEKEVWFDELAHYEVDLKKGCQSVTR